MKECSKSIQRRLADSNFVRKYFVGEGLDVGGKPDPLCLYKELFPLAGNIRTWDAEDGDAQVLAGVPDASVDFVHSSHCLEHLVDPAEALRNWLRVLRERGYLVITVPDEDLYEQGAFPSTYNRDHKWTFTIFKAKSWSDRSRNLLDLLRELGPAAEVVRLEQLSANYRFDLPRYDQTVTPVAECGIEVVIRKRPEAEILAGGRWQRTRLQPTREVRIHLNQYLNDLKALRRENERTPPFTDERDV